MGRCHHRPDASSYRKIADNGQAPGREERDQGVEDLVDDVFVEDPAVPELDQVVLQGLQFEAAGGRHVRDPDLAEVGQSRLRADRRELGARDRDFVVTVRSRIGKRLERGHRPKV
jgi:hypothetical protein